MKDIIHKYIVPIKPPTGKESLPRPKLTETQCEEDKEMELEIEFK